MSNNKSTSGISIGFFGALTLTFIILKLCNVIDWSWWWVLSPTWISAVLIITFVFIIAYYEAKIDIKKKEIEAQQRREGKQSKFMQRLQEAMDESEKKRQTKLN